MISHNNRKAIFLFCNRLGLNDDERRLIQESVCGKGSLKDFNNLDADKLLKALRRELQKINLNKSVSPGRHRNHLPRGQNVHNIPTDEQKKKIIAMSIQLYGKYSEPQMDKFCERQFRKPFRLMNSDEAIKLIEIQKSMLQRKYPDAG